MHKHNSLIVVALRTRYSVRFVIVYRNRQGIPATVMFPYSKFSACLERYSAFLREDR